MPMHAALLCAACLAAPAGAQSARAKAAAVLQGDLGEAGARALERRGLALTTAPGKPPRLAAVAWEALERDAQAAPRLAEFLSAYEAVRKGAEPAQPLDPFDDVAAMPPDGLLAGPVRAAAAALGTLARARAALGEAYGPLAAEGSLYRKPWGRALREAARADLAPSAAVPALFRLLSGPDAAKDAVPHVSAWARARGVSGAEERLAAARSAGRPSAAAPKASEAALAGFVPASELSGDLAAYLTDADRLEAALAAREALARLERDSEARELFSDLRAVVGRLAQAPDLTARLRELLEGPDEEPAARLNAPDLHARPAGTTPLEPGDKVVLSAAYWVEGAAVEVAELLYLDRGPEGLELVARQSRRRAPGGPYALSHEAVTAASGRQTYRLVLDAGGAAVERSVSVTVSEALAAARAAAAEAEALGRACRLEESAAAWSAVSESLAPAAKPARARLAAQAREAAKAVARWTADKRDLDQFLDGARLYASRERCEYRTDRAERALGLLAGLPAGCDEDVSAELGRLWRDTESRRLLQEAFRAGVARARAREADCRPAEAATLYASALALLDSDPAARCGEWEREYAAVRMTDLPRAAAAEGLAGALEAELGAARRRLADGDAAAALAAALPLATALRGLPDARCWSAQLRTVDELAEAAGVALGPRAADGLSLAPDPAAALLEEARRDWERRQAQREAELGAAERMQAPNAAGEAL